MRLFVGCLMMLLAPLALAGGAYLKQDITGHWHYPELFPPDASVDVADDDTGSPDEGTRSGTGTRKPVTPPVSTRQTERTARHP